MTVFGQAKFLFGDQGSVSQIGIRYQTAHSPGTAGGCDELRIHTESSQARNLTSGIFVFIHHFLISLGAGLTEPSSIDKLVKNC